jgi:threonine dehydrogenase-like Zn-dependent dehydrogenase
MKAYGTYFQNDPERPLAYGEVELINPPRQRLRGEPRKEGVLVRSVMVGFCGTDHELMEMGRKGLLGPKFPAG